MATLNYPNYNINSLTRLGNRYARQRTGAALDLQTGRRSPWDLPEWNPMVEGYQAQYSRGLGDLARNFNRAGVSGPAAGLGMERANDAYAGGLLQLPQQIRQSYAGEGWKGAQLGEQKRQFDRGQALQRYGMEGSWDLQRYLAHKARHGGGSMDSISQMLGPIGQMMGGIGGGMSGLSSLMGGGDDAGMAQLMKLLPLLFAV